MSKYDSIINMPHFEPKKHKRASKEERASQFGAFRALTGHEEAINETARITDNFYDLGESMAEILNRKFMHIQSKIKERPYVKIIYFEPDELKSGGKYVNFSGNIKKIDDISGKIVFTNRKEILINLIVDIDCDLDESI